MGSVHADQHGCDMWRVNIVVCMGSVHGCDIFTCTMQCSKTKQYLFHFSGLMFPPLKHLRASPFPKMFACCFWRLRLGDMEVLKCLLQFKEVDWACRFAAGSRAFNLFKFHD